MTELATVYYSTTGNHFHGIPDCPAYEMGRAVWNTGDSPIGWPTSPVFVERSVAEAMGSGKLPCTRCLPGLQAAWFRGSCEEDFGHEPFEYDGAVICRRCYTEEAVTSLDAFEAPHRFIRRQPVYWPCMSAIVLGLVPRSEQ